MKKIAYGIIALVMVMSVLGGAFGCAKQATTYAPGSAAEFFKDNLVTIITASEAGTAADLNARAIATYWHDVTGGNAQVVPKGEGGGIPGVNAIWEAKPDGLTLGFGPIGTRVASPAAFKDPAALFKDGVDKFAYIGAYRLYPYGLAISQKLPYNSVAELQKATGIKIGSTGMTKTPTIGGALVIELLGLNARVISGYGGSEDVGLAIARGEVDGYVYSDDFMEHHRVMGWVKPIVLLHPLKSTLYPTMPLASDLVKLSPQQQELLDTFCAIFPLGQMLFGPPGMSEDKVKYLRDCWDKLMKIEGFIKLQSIEGQPFGGTQSGADLAALMATVKSLDQAKIDRLNAVVKKHTVILGK